MDKIESRLRQRMAEDPDLTYSVIITFAQPVEDDLLDRLGLMPGSPVEALGQLTPQVVAEMADRDDVTGIRSSPEPNLY